MVTFCRDSGYQFYSKVTIHADSSRTKPGSRRYIHAKDVADGLMFIVNLPKDYKHERDFGGAKCPKFNVVGEEEIDNLQLAELIAESVGQELKYKLVDFHSSRPGHDLRSPSGMTKISYSLSVVMCRYAISGDLMKTLGWQPKFKLKERISQLTGWLKENPQWSNVE